MSLNVKKVRRENAHILAFIAKVKETYNLPNLLGNHFFRKAVVYICRQFNGLCVEEIKILIHSHWKNTNDDVQSALWLKMSEHPVFMKAYNALLQIYIESTRQIIKTTKGHR